MIAKIIRNILLILALPIAINAQVTSSWKAIGPNIFPVNVSGQINGIGRVCQIKFHPTNSNVMYAVSASGGLWKSDDNAQNWSSLGTDQMPQTACSSVCIDYTDDNTIYLGTGDANYYSAFSSLGIWKTSDGGKTWVQSTSGLGNLIVVDIIMDPFNHNTLVAATSNGIFKTTNGGASWLKKNVGDYRNMVLKANMNGISRVLYAVTSSAYYMSADFGETWTQITLPYNGGEKGMRLAVSKADSNVVYIGLVLDGGTILKSVDGGLSFNTQRHDPSILLNGYDETTPGQGDYDFSICADPSNASNIYLAAHCVWHSTDGGISWVRQTSWYNNLHTDMHHILFSPYDNQKIFNANDGGVWLSINGGSFWQPKSDGLGATECYYAAQSPIRKDLISIGTQDNGELYHIASGWYTNRGGDWNEKMAFDANNLNNKVYYINQNKRRNPINGTDETFTTPALYNKIEVNAGLPQTALFVGSDIYRCDDLNNTSPTFANVTNLNVTIKDTYWSKRNPSVLFLLQQSGNKILRSSNFMSANPTFTVKIAPGNFAAPAIVVANEKKPEIVYLMCAYKIYKSTDTCNTWTNITYNLPRLSIEKLFLDPNSTHDNLYVMSTKGVYYINDTSTSWTNFSLGLPNIATLKDCMFYTDTLQNSVLRISYYGRGVWERELPTITALGIADQVKKEKSIILYPNPVANGSVTMTMAQSTVGTYKVSIYNTNGQQVFTESFTNSTIELTKTINTSALAKGVYFVILQAPNKEIATNKLVIQ
jgi:photosystem II stability/assembly factor-like uncharacterized protein